MLKSTQVLVTIDPNARSLYFTDRDLFAYVSALDIKGKHEKHAFSVLWRECMSQIPEPVGVFFMGFHLNGKIREYLNIATVLVLGRARRLGQYENIACLGGTQPKSSCFHQETSIRNLMRLTHQAPVVPGEPLYGVSLGGVVTQGW